VVASRMKVLTHCREGLCQFDVKTFQDKQDRVLLQPTPRVNGGKRSAIKRITKELRNSLPCIQLVEMGRESGIQEIKEDKRF